MAGKTGKSNRVDSDDAKRKQAYEVLNIFKKLYPNPHHYLNFSNPFELLIATILSAQCTDEKVNSVTSELFKKYRSPKDFAREPIEAIEEAIRPTGFYRNKARAIKGACEAVIERFNGRVPETMEELTSLPGIARKSANAILQHAFSKVEGVVVDTHVIRVANRLGWTSSKNPLQIEKDLMSIFDRKDWKWLPFYLKSHGRMVCRAPNPRCDKCEVAVLCPSASIGPGAKKGKNKSPGKSIDRKARAGTTRAGKTGKR